MFSAPADLSPALRDRLQQPETLHEHLGNAAQIVSGLLATESDPVLLSALGGLRKRLDAAVDICHEGRQIASERVALRCQQWARARL